MKTSRKTLEQIAFSAVCWAALAYGAHCLSNYLSVPNKEKHKSGAPNMIYSQQEKKDYR